MRLSTVRDILHSTVYAGDLLLHTHVESACASDLMSDVLAFSQSGAILLTGLVTVQTVQTAFISEVRAIVFVRGKKPPQDVIDAAEEKKIPLLGTPYSMYEACGLLYRADLQSTMSVVESMNLD